MTTDRMRAAVIDRYGPPEIIRVEEVDRPVPAADEVLVRVRAATLNRNDCAWRRAHPAFQNLFVQTEFAPEVGALVATRRPRARDERQIWAAHVAAVEEQTGEVIQYETDRARFLGRGRSVRSPVSVIDGRPLSNTVGAVLDPLGNGRQDAQPSNGFPKQ